MNQDIADRIKAEFERITGVTVSATFMDKGEAHSPTMLKKGFCGVYAFMAGEYCFKVGKAGPKSKARWNSHHYNLDETTPSTLPKSIRKNLATFKNIFPREQHGEIDALDKATIQDWIKTNLGRIEFLIADSGDNFTLNLLEALAQYHLKPIFEGRLRSKGSVLR